MTRLRLDEIETLLDYFEDFIKSTITNMNTEHIEDAMNLMNKRDTLKNYITELIENKEIQLLFYDSPKERTRILYFPKETLFNFNQH